MLKYQLFLAYISVKSLFFPVHKDRKEHDFEKGTWKLTQVAHLPKQLPESSGIIYSSDSSSYLSHNDSGHPSELITMDTADYAFQKTISFDFKSRDWEDIALDPQGNIYIADIGNNSHARRNLTIYKVSPNYTLIGEIKIAYQDQTAFPPKNKKDKNYDCEAIFWHNGQLHLFSKSWGDKVVKHYEVEDQPGNYKISPKESIRLSGYITAADVSIEKQEFTLLSYGHIYTFRISDNDINFNFPKRTKYFGKMKQAEAIMYKNGKTWIVTNENGKIFELLYR